MTNHLGTRKVKQITLDHLKEYQRECGKRVGARAINLELGILISVLKEANLWTPIAARYKPLKERESDVGRALSMDELRRLEISAQNPAWLVAYNAESLAAKPACAVERSSCCSLAMSTLKRGACGFDAKEPRRMLAQGLSN
jgi:hypothetical protein